MAGLIIVLAAIAWLASVFTGFTAPSWCETTAVLILAILVLIGHAGDWRTRA
jgi:hypothetical protein